MYSSFWLYFAGAIWVGLIYYFLKKYNNTRDDNRGFYLIGGWIVFIIGIFIIGELFQKWPLEAPYIFD